jgi:phage-related protein (TIGR01555 family)
MKLLDAALRKIRTDGWYNSITGLGSALRDKSVSTEFSRNATLSETELDAMFCDNDLAETIVSAIVDDALRQGIKIESDENDDDDFERELAKRHEALNVVAALSMAAKMGRLFGGAAIYPVLDDGQDPSQPLNLERVKAVYSLLVLDRRQMQPEQWYQDPKSGKLGQVETYRLTVHSGQAYSAPLVHESRLILFGGICTTPTRKRELRGWDRSALQPVYDVLRKTGASFDSVMNLMQDMSQSVWKINGLLEVLTSADAAAASARMQAIELGRSVFRAIMLDNGNTSLGQPAEDFQRVATPTAGIDVLLDRGWQRLAAAARMPVTRLMGISPAGLNATGESDTRNWYDQVKAFQSLELGPRASRLAHLIARSMGEAEPERFRVCFPSLWQMTPLEQANLEKSTADKDKVYIDAGVLLAEEVALSRYGSGTFSTDTKVDVKLRQELYEAAAEKALDPPEPPPQLPPAMPPQSPTGAPPEGEDDAAEAA